MIKSVISISVMLLMLSPLVLAQGKTLHDKSCLQCHTSITGGNANSLYTRADHKVTTFAGLQKQVKGCALAADTDWSDTQRSAVVNYLASSFYQF